MFALCFMEAFVMLSARVPPVLCDIVSHRLWYIFSLKTKKKQPDPLLTVSIKHSSAFSNPWLIHVFRPPKRSHYENKSFFIATSLLIVFCDLSHCLIVANFSFASCLFIFVCLSIQLMNLGAVFLIVTPHQCRVRIAHTLTGCVLQDCFCSVTSST